MTIIQPESMLTAAKTQNSLLAGTGGTETGEPDQPQ